MANTPEPGMSGVKSVQDVLSMGAATLAAHVREHLGPTHDFDPLFNGYRIAPLLEREQLAQQLTQALARNSGPLDLGELDARLRDASTSHANALPRAARPLPSRSLSPTPGGLELADCALRQRRLEEADAYERLVKNGGRPLYPIELLDDVSASFPGHPIRGQTGDLYYATGDPDRHKELLRPWLDDLAQGRYFNRWSGETSAEYPWAVFQKQCQRWAMFRTWQRDNRNLKDDDDDDDDGDDGSPSLPAFLEARNHDIRRYRSERVAADELARLEACPHWLREQWDDERARRTWQRHYCRESGVGVPFSNYAAAVKARLARHGGITTRPFELHPDPKRQGRLETWLEYLSFEYWWLELFARAGERRREQCDKAWKKLQGTGTLQRYETARYIRTRDYRMRHAAEEYIAMVNVERAEQTGGRIYAATQLDPSRVAIPLPERIQLLHRGAQDLVDARCWLHRLERRGCLIKRFKLLSAEFRRARNDAARHRVLTPWILDQIPLIEAELGRGRDGAGVEGAEPREMTKRCLGGSDSPDDTKPSQTAKRRLDSSEDTNPSQTTTKTALDGVDNTKPSQTTKRRLDGPDSPDGSDGPDDTKPSQTTTERRLDGSDNTSQTGGEKRRRLSPSPSSTAAEAAPQGRRRSPRIAARSSGLLAGASA
ncbi:hypothetical protein MAPG_10607 [Magnaporthiopsis poae ATCC 64411]|uniref:Uncharacterized protein n=1 Tax=Magnaporthiopsis poae (strain ATCC 64411 / 73-15) TaxID=644358 RepID=A0A0C4CSJ9_MAGP6|nr:hypothetical protein, variant [Magnaporthiopsis poae ATCC 64411]KLU90756.1 hypothetical protein MAPG_10607 [Magnaporthiopsis poae ATCC 64411]